MKVSVIGPGSFGTAIAQLISPNVDEVNLFGRNERIINSINQNNVNNVYHPLVSLNKNISAHHLEERSLIEETDVVIMSVPSGSLKGVVKNLKPHLHDKIVISTIKGIHYPSTKLISQIIREETCNENVFTISGPTFADELIRNLLSGLTLGIDKEEYLRDIKKLMKSPNLMMDFSNDVRGVELCGVLKNVYAVAMGIFDSSFYGSNEHYSFLTACFKEMLLILRKLSFDEDLINKFCGFGDLNLTACVDKSRNRTIGLMIGKGISLNLNRSSITVEGLKSARAIKELSNKHELETPIVDFVNTSFNNGNVQSNINELLKRLVKT